MATSEGDVNRQDDAGHATPGKIPDSSVVEAGGVEFLHAGGGETVLSVGSGRYVFAGRKVRA
jgi:hypothetical protein